MNRIEDQLRECAGKLILGMVEDGAVPVEMLVEAADEINRYACQVEDLEAECDRLAAQYRAAVEHRPWWWRLIGLTHLAEH